MKEYLKQILIVLTMILCIVMAAIAVVIVWLGVVIHSVIDWFTGKDGFTHNKPKSDYIELSKQPPAGLSKEQFDSVFVEKPLPKPYSPLDNPLYVELTPAQSVAVITFNEIVKKSLSKPVRHNIRDSKGRYIKRKGL